MDLFADENLAKEIVYWLRAAGHDILYAAETKPGSPDADWLEIAEKEHRIILTTDKDFGELIFRDGLNSHGVVLLRLSDLTVTEALARLQSVWAVVEANPAGRFVVITEHKTRVRRLPARP
jgi:predicted nuclease of predicted toxin-antitoxin system